MGLLAVGSVGSLSAVVRLDGEAVLPLSLTVQGLFRADQALAGGAVQNHGFKLDRPRTRGTVVNAEAADFTWDGIGQSNNLHVNLLRPLSEMSGRL